MPKKTSKQRPTSATVVCTYKEFLDFYNGLSILKKLGYKFYSLSDYLNKEAGKEKREKLKEEKMELEAKS